MTQTAALLPQERRITSMLASIFAARMLGLFMLLPVLARHLDTIEGATPFWIGLTLGIYGLTQAMLQVPFGMLSDRLGRHRVIRFGLGLFITGSLVCYLSDSVWGLLAGRALQGAGAIGATLLALLADSTRDVVRTKAMAIMGVSIGGAFVIAFIAGPWLDGNYGLSSIFLLTISLSLLALILLHKIPKPAQLPPQPFSLVGAFQPALWRLYLSIGTLHALLTALFLLLPLKVQAVGLYLPSETWKGYLPALVLSVLLFSPCLRYAHNVSKAKPAIMLCIILLAISGQLMLTANSNWLLWGVLSLFFAAFNLLEALLPSLVSRLAPQAQKGSVLGIYSSSQFLGIFLGGIIGGFLSEHYGTSGILGLCWMLAALWLAAMLKWPTCKYEVN